MSKPDPAGTFLREGERGLPANARLSMSNIVKISALGAATLLFVAPFGEFAGEYGIRDKGGWPGSPTGFVRSCVSRSPVLPPGG